MDVEWQCTLKALQNTAYQIQPIQSLVQPCVLRSSISGLPAVCPGHHAHALLCEAPISL
jgi:hypothetical protein